MFSARLPASLSPNAVSQAIARLRAAGTSLVDLTQSNPTATSIPYPPDLLAPLGDPRAARYQPDALGLPEAREAVARECSKPGGPRIDPERVILTASTSEAYAILFKLLCDPGDEVLVPQPSYPLFDLLTALEAVVSRPYHLEFHGVWSIDRAGLERAIGPRTRAVLVVSPNNPTGSMLRAADREWLADLCGAHGLAIISDEVFGDYPLAPRADASSFAGEARALTFVLGGLSKSAGLPQVKLGWMLASGPDPFVQQALDRLEIICDTMLSVSTTVQCAAPAFLEGGRQIQMAIRERIVANLGSLRTAVAAHPSISLLEPEGGWSAVVRVPATASEEALVLRILGDAHVIVHPGYFFDFPHEAFLVVSLIPDPVQFEPAIRRVLSIASGGAA